MMATAVLERVSGLRSDYGYDGYNCSEVYGGQETVHLHQQTKMIQDHFKRMVFLKKKKQDILDTETKTGIETVEDAEEEMTSLRVISAVPPEIWIYIFEMCVEEDRAKYPDDAAGFGVPSALTAPLVLCHVCSHWRRVVIGTPGLWTSLSLIITPSTPSLMEKLRFWTERSKEMDLALNIETEIETGVLEEQIADLLRQVLGRCQKLRISVSNEILCRILRMGLQRLDTLEIRTIVGQEEIFPLSICAPRLRTLVLLGPCMPLFSDDLLPWLQLREYQGRCWARAEQHLEIVARCPGLVRCILHVLCGRAERVPGVAEWGVVTYGESR